MQLTYLKAQSINEILSGYLYPIGFSEFILHDSTYDWFSCPSIDDNSSYTLCNISGGNSIIRNISSCIDIAYIINLY